MCLNRLILLMVTVALLPLYAGCMQTQVAGVSEAPVRHVNNDIFNGEFPTIFHVARGLAVQLRTNIREGSLSDHPCVVTTLADIDNLADSSRFGRVMAEALGAELFTQGGNVRDVRTSSGIMLQPRQGEFNLTRDAAQAAKTVDADSVVVGTYATGKHSVAVTIRMIDIGTMEVLSVAVTEMVRTEAVDSLLAAARVTADQDQSESGMPAPTVYDTI